jgi:hypothetical protein
MKWSEFSLEPVSNSKYEVNSNVFVFDSDAQTKIDLIQLSSRVRDIVFAQKNVEIVLIYENESEPDSETLHTLSTHYDNVLVICWKPKIETNE